MFTSGDITISVRMSLNKIICVDDDSGERQIAVLAAISASSFSFICWSVRESKRV